MRLIGVAMIRNEVDVVEAFVRHNLSVLDALAVLDHGSFDRTSEVLEKLRAEGLPVSITRDADPAYRQSETMTALARDVLERDRADFVFALDADEFLKVESRSELERALSDVPSGMHATMHWLTYVPGAFDPEFGPGHLWWRLKEERQGLGKVVVSRALLDRPEDMIAMGNHAVVSGAAREIPPHARPRRDSVALAHCPVRSRAQFEAKIIVGYLANLASGPRDRRLARHWRELYEELSRGGSFGEERLREIASNYGLPMLGWRPSDAIELVEDPVRLAAEQRYASARACDPLTALLRFTEVLVDEERQRALRAQAIDAGRPQYVTL